MVGKPIETRPFLEPSNAVYDKPHVSHDGYANAVPIVHKSAAVSELIAQLAIKADEDPDYRARLPGSRACVS